MASRLWMVEGRADTVGPESGAGEYRELTSDPPYAPVFHDVGRGRAAIPGRCLPIYYRCVARWYGFLHVRSPVWEAPGYRLEPAPTRLATSFK